MNRIYRLVWNTALGAFVAVSELTRAKGKRSGVSRSIASTVLGLLALDAAAAEPATNELPTGGHVVQGVATLNQQGARLDINQSSNTAIIDWQTFNVGRDATVSFWQPSSAATVLNRVLSSDATSILGRLTANGNVFISNPNGVLFGSSARVDVGGLVATSMQIGDEDFLAGHYRFTNGGGSVINQGSITAADGGYLALLAPEVRNEGVLSARLGTVALAAGQAATLQLDPGAPFAVQVDAATIDVLAENRHLIAAEGGQVILSASAAERLIDTAIPGATGATGLVAENGTVRLVNVEGEIRAAGIAIDGGAVGVTRVAGTLDASSGVDGGSIRVTGDKVLIDAGAVLDASGRTGGEVLVGGDRQGANVNVRNASRTFVNAGAVVRADGGVNDSQVGDAGRVIVYSHEATQVYGDLSARGGAAGGNGGFIETSGGWLDITSVPDATAAVGRGGEWLIDPYNITIQAAGPDTSIGGSPNWSSTGDNAILTTGSIQTALNAGTNVTVTTGAGGSQGGDIVVSSDIVKSAGGNATLTLNAHRDIVIGAAITSSSGALSLAFNADTDNDLAGAIVLNNNLTTNGGAIDFLDGLVIGGGSALAINTSGGSGGNVNFNGQVLIGNTNGVSITTGGGNVTFASLVDSGNGYTFVNNNLTWDNARIQAASGTGANVGDTYLATITSALEMSRAAATANYTQSWLGGNDAAVEGTWRWVTGPEGLENGGQGRIIMVGNRSGLPALTGYNGYNGGYVNWNAGEPNDYNGAEDALQLGFGAAGQWNDLPISSTLLPYVRETNLAASPLSISTGTGSVTFNGDVGANKALGALTIGGSGNVYLNANTLNVSGNVNFNAGGDVIIGATNSPTIFADDGSIFLRRNVVKNAGADASLTLRADGDIVIDTSADITSTSGRLGVTLNSNRDATGDGGINIASGSVITSNGGDVVLGGGTTPSSVGAIGSAATAQRGVFLSGAQINAGAGNITINGRGGNADLGIGVDLVSSTLETTSGGINVTGIGGTGAANTAIGISVFSSTVVRSTAGGAVALTGTASATGINESGVSLDVGSTVGALNGGSVTLVGTGSGAGTGTANHGVVVQNSSSVLGGGNAAVSLTGTAGTGSSGIATLTGSNVIGNSAAFAGNVTLTADTVALANVSVRTSGALAIQPLTTSTTMGIGNSASGTLNLTATELATLQDGFSGITFGRSDGTGDIDIRDYTFTDSVAFSSGAGDGDIAVNGDLRNTGGSISFEAGDSISVATTGDVTTQGGAITLNSDRDASGAGNISLASGAALTSNGGNITLRGGSAALGAVSDPTSVPATFLTTVSATGARGVGSAGVELNGATIAAAGGNIEMRGVASDGYDGVRLAGSSSVTTTGAGTIAMYGVGGATGAESDGVAVINSSVSTQNGELRVHGLGRGGDNAQGVELYGAPVSSTLRVTNGNLVVRGASTATGTTDQGVMIANQAAVRTTGSGNIDIVGRGGGTVGGVGVHLLTDAYMASAGGNITLTGYGSSSGTGWNNEGVKVDDAIVQVDTTTDTNLTVTGYGGTGTDYNIGVNVRVGGMLRTYASAAGSLTVNGTGGNASGTGNWGVLIEAGGIYESLGAAPISITGRGGTGTNNYGIISSGDANDRIGSATMTGDITLRADTIDFTRQITVRSTGAFALEPYNASSSMRIGNTGAGSLTFNSTELTRLADGFRQITFGRADGTGLINVDATTFTDPVRFLNTGAGSSGISLNGAVNAGSNSLWLSSAGAVTQSAAMSAGQLLLTGNGSFTLTHASNAIGTLAGSLGGNLNFNNNGSFSVGSITANGSTYDGLVSSGNTTVLRASGATADLTLQRGISTSAAGTNLQLVAGRNFINAFGVSALDAGAGRWLVWSASPLNDTRGGLSYAFRQYGATYGVTAAAQGGNGFMYSLTPTLTPTLTGSVSRVYDGTTAMTLTSANFAASGAVDGDVVVIGTATAGSVASRDVGTGKLVTATNIAYVSGTNAGAAVYGYQLSSTTASASIGAITPRTVTASLTGSVVKEYDGNSNATLAGGNYSLSGVIGGDVVSLNNPIAGTYASANAGSNQAVSVTGLSISGAGASNYVLASSGASAAVGTITPRALTITALDASQTYGDANPAFGASYSGFVAGQNASVLGGSLAFNTLGGATSNAGVYAINASGLTSTNYALNYVPGSLTINPAALSVTAGNLVKVYGDADPTPGYSVGGAGLRNGDVLSGSLFAPTGASATAGTHAISQGSLAASSNYTMTFTPGTLTVSPAALTITAQDRVKVYGEADPALGYALSGSGLRYTDTLTGALTAPTGASATAGLHQISQGTLAASSNYAVTFVPGTLNVSPALLSVTALDQIKTYGGVDPSFTYSVGGAGLSYGDTLSGSLLAPTGASATAGTHTIGQGSLTASSNYTLSFVPGTLSVSRAQLAITADNQIKTYGDADPALTYSLGGAGLQYGDALTGALSAPTGASATAGAHQIAQGSLSAGNNYDVTFAPATLTVTPAALVVTATDTSKVYGDADPAATYVVGGAGLRYGDSLSGSLFTATGASATAGTHAITQGTLGASANYTMTFVPGTLSVAAAPLLVTALDQVKVYGDADPSLTYMVGGAGLRYGDVLTGSLFAPGGASATAGVHQILQGSLAASGNYIVSFVPGTLNVAQAPLTISAIDQIKVYGSNDPALTYTVGGAGLRYGDALTGSLFAPAGAAATAGVHAISLGTLDAGSNYAITYVGGTLSVARASLVVTALDQIKTYGDADPALAYTIGGAGLQYGDTLSGSLIAPRGSAATAGTHTITQGTLTAGDNYDLTFNPGTLNVARAQLSITANDQIKVYGDADPLLTYTIGGSGLRYNDTLTGGLTAPIGQGAFAGQHLIQQGSLAASSNYDVTFQPGTLSVSRAQLVIAANPQVRFVYNENLPLTATGTGLQYGETLAVATGLQLTTSATANSPAGIYGIDAGGASAANYDISYRSSTLEVMSQDVLTEMPQGGEVVNRAGTLAAAPIASERVTTAPTITTSAPSMTAMPSSIRNGGIATTSGAAPAIGTTTMSAGFLAVEPLATLDLGSNVDFTLPADTFRHSDANALVTVVAMCADGSPLPATLTYDAASRSIHGTVDTELEIVFVARDGMGGEATTSMTLRPLSTQPGAEAQ